MATVGEILYRKGSSVFLVRHGDYSNRGGKDESGLLEREWWVVFPRSGLVQQGISWTEIVQLKSIIAVFSITAKNMPDLPIFPYNSNSSKIKWLFASFHCFASIRNGYKPSSFSHRHDPTLSESYEYRNLLIEQRF
jgi:hypothetical protein